MDKKDKIEIFVGGAFGIIAIIAAIIEFKIESISSMAGCIKDIAGTMVVVVLLFASIKIKPSNLKGRLQAAVDDWGSDNAPLIFKTIGYIAESGTVYSQGYKLLQNPENYIKLVNDDLSPQNPEWEKYAKYKSTVTGKFINLPSFEYMTKNDFDVLFVMNQHHFTAGDKDYRSLIEEIRNAFNKRYKSIGTAPPSQNSYELLIHFNRITSKKDIDQFVDALDFVLSLVKVIV